MHFLFYQGFLTYRWDVWNICLNDQINFNGFGPIGSMGHFLDFVSINVVIILALIIKTLSLVLMIIRTLFV